MVSSDAGVCRLEARMRRIGETCVRETLRNLRAAGSQALDAKSDRSFNNCVRCGSALLLALAAAMQAARVPVVISV